MAEGIQGRMLWYQLNTSDLDAGVEFYKGLIGWGTEMFTPPGGSPYTMFTRGGMPIGGAMTLMAEAKAAGSPPHWLSYVGADDVDATYAKAMAAGAKSYVAPADIPEVGRFAVIADPAGAIFAIYTPGSQPPPEGELELGDVSWHEISGDDLEQSWGFYQSVFGWEVKQEMDMGPGGMYRIFGRPGHDRMIGGMYKRSPEMPANTWAIYFLVDDLNQRIAQAEKEGSKIVMPVMEVPGGDHVVGMTDPQGVYFSMHQKGALKS